MCVCFVLCSFAAAETQNVYVMLASEEREGERERERLPLDRNEKRAREKRLGIWMEAGGCRRRLLLLLHSLYEEN